jgi:hypothetical protein
MGSLNKRVSLTVAYVGGFDHLALVYNITYYALRKRSRFKNYSKQISESYDIVPKNFVVSSLEVPEDLCSCQLAL